MRKNILFVIGNEYHLYSAIIMFYKYFNSDTYNFKLIITKRPTNHRIDKEYKLPFKYFVLEDYLNVKDLKAVKEFPNYNKSLSTIFEKVDELYTYFDFTLLSSLIINWVKKNPNSITHLVQEGVAGYFKYKMPYYKVVRFYLVFLYLKYFKGFREIDFVYQWGYSSKIDILKMCHPDKIRIRTKAKIEKLELNIDVTIDKKIKDIFNFKESVDSNKRYLLYLPIGQARGSAAAKQREYSLMDNLIKIAKSHELEFLIKTKSGLDSQSYKDHFGDQVQIIDTKFPVEILISDIQNSIIISAFSSSALHNVNNNTYLWIYPILNFKSDLRPFTPNIKLIQTYPELEQCIK